MEVGAVKQAFNNEVILLKKGLNQAKIQIIHKLTRKAKTFTEKKGPDKIKEKLKRKAESAVNEVLIIKKIKPKDVAKFIVTHKGELKAYLNKPKVDQDKACARLLMHKSLQEKYKYIRERFSNVRIEDLFMSRQERRKLKKEAKEKQKKKKEKKNKKVVNSEGDWDVEDIDMGDASRQSNGLVTDDEELSTKESDDDDEESGASEEVSDSGEDASDGDENPNDEEKEQESASNDSEDEVSATNIPHKMMKMTDRESEDQEEENSIDENKDNEEISNDLASDKESIDDNKDVNIVKLAKPFLIKSKDKKPAEKNLTKNIGNKVSVQKTEKKAKNSKKNTNFNEKILKRKFKKGAEDLAVVETKVVDPFFVTATGENYMSVVEPRQPDEFKEIHRQGNRKLRRAAMFGHEPRINLRRDKFGPSNDFNNRNGFNKKSEFNSRDGNEQSNFDERRFNSKSNDRKLDRHANFKDRKIGFNDKQTNINDRQANFNDRKANFNDRKSSQFSRNQDEKPEKLHPSWEAKKKKSGILPYQGKKIVFGDS